jgi:cytochrome c556
MRALFKPALALAGLAATAMACNATPAPPAPAAYQPVVSLNEIMVNIVDPHSHEIWDAAGDPAKAPKTDEDWRNLRHASITLAAAGNLTMQSGNGPKDQVWRDQKDWKTLSQAISNAGLAAAEATRNKSVAGLSKAGDQVLEACLNCHHEYKLDVPKIWADKEIHGAPPVEPPH